MGESADLFKLSELCCVLGLRTHDRAEVLMSSMLEMDFRFK